MKLIEASLLLIALPMLSIPQAATKPPTFEVASIKSNKSVNASAFGGCHPDRAIVDTIPKGRCIFRNVPATYIIAYAYDIPILRLDQFLSGGPDWIRNEKYDVEAKSEDDFANESDLKLMTRTLLADRFKLTLREVSQDVPGYALVVTRSGPKLKASDGSQPASTGATSKGIGGSNSSMEALARVLSQRLHRPVVDKTGISGKYDFTVSYEADHNDPLSPAIFTALQEQLGLKLESEKTAQKKLIIESAQRPSLSR